MASIGANSVLKKRIMDQVLTIKDQIYDAEKQLLSAIKAGDIETLGALLHDGLLFILPNGQTVTKQMDIDAHRSGNLVIEKISFNIDDICIIDTTAVTTLTKKISGKMHEQSFEGEFKYIRVWKFTHDKWQVIAGSGMQIAPMPNHG